MAAFRQSSSMMDNGHNGHQLHLPPMSSNRSSPAQGDLDDQQPSFGLEHLATFTVDRASGIVFPTDGMRKLLQLEKTSGIWSQKMEMALSKRQQLVMILDHESKSVIEKFPIQWIESPTPFVNNDPMEMYNNILVFVVVPPASRTPNSTVPSEMHIFQCQNVDANMLSDFLITMKRNSADLNDNRNWVSDRNSNNNEFDYVPRRDEPAPEPQREIVKALPKTNHAPFADSQERDVHVLNYCFDDIEKFIARLQHLASVTKEMERRNRYSSKGMHQNPGDGMMHLRTRPPSESEFMDIFAKFKLSFNLLAKLRAHIHDPNAPELVHFLFTPLALIVDASYDIIPVHQSAIVRRNYNLPSQVIFPLLTSFAVNLLSNCVTSREAELWRSLGDAWQVPRIQFLAANSLDNKNYHPVFFDGWSPEFPLIFEDESELEKRQVERVASPIENQFQGNPDQMDDTESLDSIEQRRYAPQTTETDIVVWVRDLERKGAKIVEVTYPRTANNDKELTVKRGEVLEIVDDSRKWWRARNIHGQVGFVPHTIVVRFNGSKNDDANLEEAEMLDEVFQNPLYTKQSFRDSRTVSNSSFIMPTPAEIKRQSSIVKRESYINHSPDYHTEPPPQPPPLPPVTPPTPRMATAERITPKPVQTQASTESYGVQEELKNVLHHFRENRRNLDILKTPNIYIQQSASKGEVQEWLRAKGFSEGIVNTLKDLNGSQLFALQRKQLEESCGVEEGRRLYSQITIQRNVSGYQTARSSELRAILAKARQKMEHEESD